MGATAVARVRREALNGSSDSKTQKTLVRMAELVDRRASDPRVRYAVYDIVRQVADRDVAGQIAAIRAWLAQRCKFLSDPVQDELIIDPTVLLGDAVTTGSAYGDCDDVATLAATIGQSIGIPARFVVASFDGGPMSHVWAELHDGARWHELDVTRRSQTPLTVRRRWDIPLYGRGGARAGIRNRVVSGLGEDPITIGTWTLDLDAPLWFGLDTKTWLMIGAGGVVLLILMRR